MKVFKKLFLVLPVIAFILSGCNQEAANIEPTQMIVASSPVKVIVHSVRDLNDIVTLRFTPKNTTNRNVIWSCEKNDFISLVDSTITANQIGTAIVTATSVENKNLSCDVEIQVYDPNSSEHMVTYDKSTDYNLLGLKNTYQEGEEVSFSIEVLNTLKDVKEVKANEDLLSLKENQYSFLMPAKDVHLSVSLKDKEVKRAESVQLTPSTLNLVVGKADAKITANVLPIDTSDSATWEITSGNDVISITPTANEVKVHALKEGEATVRVTYNEKVFEECAIHVTEESSSIEEQVIAKYNVSYDLAGRKTAKAIASTDELMSVLKLEGEEENIITSISAYEAIYGGGNGGRGDTAWYANDLLKVGTTSVNGSISFSLSTEINAIRITGYVSDNACKIRVGSSDSTDWTEEADDNQTTLITCSEMTESTKDTIENKLTSSITIDFLSTKDLKLATTNKKTLYITSIEFIVK